MLVNDRHLYIPYLALSHVRYAVVSLVTDVSEDRTLLLLFNPIMKELRSLGTPRTADLTKRRHLKRHQFNFVKLSDHSHFCPKY